MLAGIPGLSSLPGAIPLPGLEDPYATARFDVIIDRITLAVFTECTLPSLSMTPLSIQEGGQNAYVHKLPTRVEVGTVKLRFGVCRSSDLLLWYLQVMMGDKLNATHNMIVMMYDPLGFPVVLWTFKDAYPIRWTGPTLRAGESAVAVEEIEFAFTAFGVNGLSAE
ncbi:MAG: phage tail protein [Anaerolineae bacterium]|jgi:phage tail-like protein|nr:phage tail protein [Anaerolineae bacterium]